MPAPKMLSGLPKPLLFGLYGAIGGLLGALLFGEPIWAALKPPPPLPPDPQVAVSASATVQVYARSENTFPVRIVRERFEGPVTVTFAATTAFKIAPITIPADKTEGTATITVDASAAPGETPLLLTAQGSNGISGSGSMKVQVLPTPPPPPALAVAVPPTLTVYKKGTGRFTVSVARRGYDGPISVAVENLPEGVKAAPTTIPEAGTETDVTLTAADTTALGTAPLTVSVEATTGKLKATTPTQLIVSNPPIAPVDIVFVLDVTASMQWAIDDLKNGIGKFADTLTKNQLNFRLGLVTFRDLSRPDESVDVIEFKPKEVFTNDAKLFREATGTLKASGGGDIPESSLEGVVAATKMPYRQGATRILLLLTDAPPKIREVNVEAAAAAVKAAGIDSAHLVIQRFDQEVYKPLLTAGTGGIPGKYFNLGDVVRGDEGFDGLLDTFGKVVTAAAFARNPDTKPVVASPPDPPKVAAAAAATPKAAEAAPAPTIPSLQSREAAAAGSEKRVVARSGVWAGAIAALVCLALLAGQHHYLRGTLPAPKGIAVGLLGGLVVGLLGGAAGQSLYMVKPALGFQVLGWTLLGGLAGAGLSPFIPNMKWFLGLAGGALGGSVGAIGFLIASRFDETVGRLAGGLLLGFCIGLMVAIVEAAFRRAWLEVRFGERETILVNLGPEPVKIGGDSKVCTVWARGAAPLALRFFVRDGKVICDDTAMKREGAVAEGFSKEVGNVTVTVRTSATTGDATVPVRPAPTPAKATPAKPMANDEYDSLPMPLSPPSAKPAEKPTAKPVRPASEAPLSLDDEPTPPPAKPLPTKPANAAPPAPPKPAPKPPTPKAAVKPASVPPAVKSEDACPSCGRVNAGKPKQRYCMVCDETY